MDMLRVSHVSKSFGSHVVLDDLNFAVKEHTIYGFIGQNGAGKTTTMKMILGLLKIDQGEIEVNGQKVTYGQNKTNQFIGYLPDVPEFYGYMTPMEYLKLCGEISGMSSLDIQKKASELLELVGLKETHTRIQGFSRGMKQRLRIAQALLNSPRLLICDEPTSALDPVGRKEILDILLSIKNQTTVIFSTHILSDVERICDEIALLHHGKIAMEGKLEDLKKLQRSNGFEIECYNLQDADYLANQIAGSQRLSSTKLYYPQKTKEEMTQTMLFIVNHQMTIQKIEMCEPTLENVFMEVIEK